MAIRIITETERNCHEAFGCKFYYRRISAGKLQSIQKANMTRGIVDHAKAGLAILEYCLLDWEGVLGEDDKSIPFSKSLIQQLPDEVILELTPIFTQASPNKEDQLGN